MAVGYSNTPLIKKLGIKPGFRLLLVGTPDHYLDLLESLPEGVSEVAISSHEKADFIHFFVKEEPVLKEKLTVLKNKLSTNGMMWISWPKKASKVQTSVSDAVVRKAGLEIGLVDVKVCAIDPIWSGLKFMYRLKDR